MGVHVRVKPGKEHLGYWVFIKHQGHRKSLLVGDKETADILAKNIQREIALNRINLDSLGQVKQPPLPSLPFPLRRAEFRGSGPCVYFLQQEEEGPVKIGYTGNIMKRLETYQTYTHKRVRLLAVARGWGRIEEQALHTHFAENRLEREWFTLSAELIHLIRCLNAICQPQISPPLFTVQGEPIADETHLRPGSHAQPEESGKSAESNGADGSRTHDL
jgi:hypothetical protein